MDTLLSAMADCAASETASAAGSSPLSSSLLVSSASGTPSPLGEDSGVMLFVGSLPASTTQSPVAGTTPLSARSSLVRGSDGHPTPSPSPPLHGRPAALPALPFFPTTAHTPLYTPTATITRPPALSVPAMHTTPPVTGRPALSPAGMHLPTSRSFSGAPEGVHGVNTLAELSHALLSATASAANNGRVTSQSTPSTPGAHTPGGSTPTMARVVDPATGKVSSSPPSPSFAKAAAAAAAVAAAASTLPIANGTAVPHNHAPKPRHDNNNAATRVQIRVKLACSNCKASKTKCDDERPCRRCIRTDRSHTCVDSERTSLESGSDSEEDLTTKAMQMHHQQQQQQQQQQFVLRQQQQINAAAMQPFMMMPNHFGGAGGPMSFNPNGQPQAMFTQHQMLGTPGNFGAQPMQIQIPLQGTMMQMPLPTMQPQLQPQMQPQTMQTMQLQQPQQPMQMQPQSVTVTMQPSHTKQPSMGSSPYHSLPDDDERPGKKTKAEDSTIVLAQMAMATSATMPNLESVPHTNSSVMSTEVKNENGSIVIPGGAVTMTTTTTTTSSSSSTVVVEESPSGPRMPFCSPQTAAGTHWLETLIMVGLPHLHTWQAQVRDQQAQAKTQPQTGTPEQQAAQERSLHLLRKRLEWLQSFFRFMHTGGHAKSLEKMQDLTSTLAVPKHLYGQLQLGVLLFPLGAADFEHHTPPWVNLSLTRLLGYQHPHQLELLFSSLDGLASFNHASNLATYVPSFIDAVMSGTTNFCTKTKWRHVNGHWVEMLESLNMTYDPTDGHVVYAASLMQVIQARVPEPAPQPIASQLTPALISQAMSAGLASGMSLSSMAAVAQSLMPSISLSTITNMMAAFQQQQQQQQQQPVQQTAVANPMAAFQQQPQQQQPMAYAQPPTYATQPGQVPQQFFMAQSAPPMNSYPSYTMAPQGAFMTATPAQTFMAMPPMVSMAMPQPAAPVANAVPNTAVPMSLVPGPTAGGLPAAQ